MAEETVGFWDRIGFIVLSDDDARWKAIGWIILIVGIFGSVDLALLDSSVDDSVLLMGSLILILSIVRIALYTSFGRSRPRIVESSSISRRALILQGGVFVVALMVSLRLPRAEARVVERKLQEASGNPFDAESVKLAENTVAAAREGHLKVDTRIVSDTGAKFIHVAEQNSDAWSAVQEFLSYRSFLNADLVPALTPATGTSKYRSSATITALQPNPQHRPAFQVSFAGGYASGDKSARLERLSDPQPEGSEFAYFIIDGGNATIGLDDEYMRNVIIRNSDISYSGGRVRLENVWFVNCTFQTFGHIIPESEELGRAILANVPVSFPTLS